MVTREGDFVVGFSRQLVIKCQPNILNLSYRPTRVKLFFSPFEDNAFPNENRQTQGSIGITLLLSKMCGFKHMDSIKYFKISLAVPKISTQNTYPQDYNPSQQVIYHRRYYYILRSASLSLQLCTVSSAKLCAHGKQ